MHAAARARAAVVAIVTAVIASPCVHAQTVHLYGGAVETRAPSERTAGWTLDYIEPVAGPFEVGFTHLNEGHLEDHHRDGYTAQAWLRSPTSSWGLAVAAGVGPYYYFDTVRVPDGYRNQHGWGVVYTLLGEWRIDPRWSLALRLDHVEAAGSFDSTLVQLGVGYRWAESLTREEAPAGVPAAPRNQLGLMLGRTVVNSFDSQHAVAGALEYRRALNRWSEWTVTFLQEGDAKVVERNGIATQLWVTRHVYDDRISLAVGLGPYFTIERGPADDKGKRVAALTTLTASYAFTPRWLARVSWNRVFADEHRDTDVFLAGVAYGW